MIETTKYSGVAAFIISNAVNITEAINATLHLGHREDEDIFQEIVTCACKAQQTYRKGAVSEACFVFRSMKRAKVDIERKYLCDCRKAFLWEVQEQEEDEADGPVSCERTAQDNPDIIGQAHVEAILDCFSPRQRAITKLLLEEKSLREIGKITRLSIGVVRGEQRKMQEIVKKLYLGEHNFGSSDEKME